jgi:uncharacterized protein (UPF0333 family)
MINMKKGQLAVETLLIYGVVILIVMLAIGALIAFGVLDLGGLLPDQCVINDAFTCENYVVTPTQVQLELRNTLGKNIDSLTVDIEGEGNNEGLWGCNPQTSTTLIPNGEQSLITLTCNVQVPTGKKIQGVMSITFRPVGSQIQRTVNGDIRATVS